MSPTLSDWEDAATWREYAVDDLLSARLALRRALGHSPVSSTEYIELRRLLAEVEKCKFRFESSATRCWREAESLARLEEQQ